MIAAAMSFNSGILLFADAAHAVAAKRHDEPRNIFRRQYGSDRECACSLFVVSEPVVGNVAAFHECEQSLAHVPPGDCTIDRMRHTIEQLLRERWHDQDDVQPSEPERSALVALYSGCERKYSLFRTTGTTLAEVAGYDCEGTAAYLGHYLIRNRYAAARSMDMLDLNTVFAIAIETLESIRAVESACGKSSEMVVMYADGHVSEVQNIPRDTRKQRNVALTGLARA
jgi:hypothetical protein